MPKYRFTCEACDVSVQLHKPASITTMVCPTCFGPMNRQLPTISGNPDISEVVNKTTGQIQKKDQSIMIKDRHDKYYWSVEVPRMVNSGTYGLDTMLENGWIWFDDNKRMQIYTKPPNER